MLCISVFSRTSYNSEYPFFFQAISIRCFLSWRICLSRLSAENKQDLFFLGSLENVKLIKGVTQQNQAYLLADVLQDNQVIRFATNQPLNCPNELFWNFNEAICVTAVINKDGIEDGQALELTQLIPQADQRVKDIAIYRELDGLLKQFGKKFWETITKESEVFSNTFDTKTLVDVIYKDKYINSPWVVLLISKVLTSLKQDLGDRWQVGCLNMISAEINSLSSPKGSLLARDFKSTDEKESFMFEYFSNLATDINVELQDTRDMAHARVLTLIWQDGTHTNIRPDHGFGNWRWDGRFNAYIDRNTSWLEQIDLIRGIEDQADLQVKNNELHPTYLVISEVQGG